MTANGFYSAISTILAVDQTYEVKAAFQTFNGTDGTFTSPVSIYLDAQTLGPVAQQMALGVTPEDFGVASMAVNLSDDFGLASSASIATIDLGLASA